MRTPRLGLLTLLFSACLSSDSPPGGMEGVGGEAGLSPPLMDDFLDHVPVVPCQRWAGPGLVRSLTPAGTEHLLALSDDGRTVSLLDPELRVQEARTISQGRSAPLDPVDAWVLGDSLLVVADGGGRALHLWSWRDTQSPGERISLPFIPHRLVPLEGGVGVVPLGGAGGTLLQRWDRNGLEGVAIPPASLEDPRLTILAGALVTTVSASGEAFLAHPLLVPLIHRVTGSLVESALLPIPDGQRGAVGRIPRPPFEEEEILGMLAPALDLAPGAAGSILVLTRSGPRRGGFREKAILRLDGSIQVREAGRLPVNLVLLARQDAGGRVMGMDPAGGWYRCGPLAPLKGEEQPLPGSRQAPLGGGVSLERKTHPNMVQGS